jgi:hypothetical protein
MMVSRRGYAQPTEIESKQAISAEIAIRMGGEHATVLAFALAGGPMAIEIDAGARLQSGRSSFYMGCMKTVTRPALFLVVLAALAASACEDDPMDLDYRNGTQDAATAGDAGADADTALDASTTPSDSHVPDDDAGDDAGGDAG